MQRWLFLLFLLYFACTKAASTKPAVQPMASPENLSSLEKALDDSMLALGLPAEPSLFLEVTPTTTRSLDDSQLSVAKEAQVEKTNRGNLFKDRRSEREAKKSEQTQCQRTCELVDNICDVAARICQLTDKLTDDPEAPKRCERAKSSCSRAQKQGESCGCGEDPT
jgi:hypothetical protein